MPDKIKKLPEKFKNKALLFTNRNETFYLTGAPFDGFWLAALKNKIYVICSAMTENQVRGFFAGTGIEIYTGAPFAEKSAEIFARNGEKNVLTDPGYISAAGYLNLKAEFDKKNIRLQPFQGLLNDMRAVKDEEEIANLRRSCRIVSGVCESIKKEIRPGMSELDVHYAIIELFAGNHVKESFTPIVAAGTNSANPHHCSSGYKIKEDDIVMMDLGCVYKGYCSDLTRTYYLGKINGKFKKIWDIVKNAQNAVLKEIKAGLPVSLADKTARAVIEAAGYKDKFIHTTGHGVGIEIHEMPSLSSNAEGLFLRNMAVTVEPGVYLNNEFGIRIEDTVLITENGCEILTSAAYL